MNPLFLAFRDALVPLYGQGEARAVAFLVFEDAFGVSRTDIYVDKVRQFSEDECTRLHNICKQLLAGHPVQQVLGCATFCGRSYKVTPDVLIPRPETEELVAWGIEKMHGLSGCASSVSDKKSSASKQLCVLDAGTGSGCIAISLKLALDEANVTAWDISDAALEVARKNAQQLGARVHFEHHDMLQMPSVNDVSQYHLIVSNPPYICQSEAMEMERHVLDFEPHCALFVPDDDPLRFYRALCRLAQRLLLPGGWLLVEINRAYAEHTAALMRESGLHEVEIREDAYGNPRMVGGRM